MTVPLVQFELLKGVSHAISTRHGGVSHAPYESLNLGFGTTDVREHVTENRRRLASALGVEYRDIASAQLTHGNAVAVFGKYPTSVAMPSPAGYQAAPIECASEQCTSQVARLPIQTFAADGVVSALPGLHVMMTFADCVPILFADRRKGVVGAAHAGWRGTALGVAPAVVRSMQTEFGCSPAEIVVAIGPSIGPCCYVVGQDVPETFAANGAVPVFQKNGLLKLDLWATNEAQLRSAGVLGQNLENSRICSSCNTDMFYSHRAENGLTGRFGLCIGLRNA